MRWISRLLGRADADRFTLPSGFIDGPQVPSPDAGRLAYLVRGRFGVQVEVNGRVQGHADAIGGLTFGADSRTLAYAAFRNGGWWAVCDGRAFGPYDDIGRTSPIVRPDGAAIAYAARQGTLWFTFVDGDVVGGPYDGFAPGGLLFSDDSRRLAWAAKHGDTWVVAVGAREVGHHPAVSYASWVFSPDSRRFAYGAFHDFQSDGEHSTGRECLVLDGVPQKAWPRDSRRGLGLGPEIVFSPDGQRVAYRVQSESGTIFVVDGHESQPHGGIVSGMEANPQWPKYPGFGRVTCRPLSFRFSFDGRRYAYAVSRRLTQRHVVVIDGEVMAEHPGVINAPIAFSPDSSRLAYGASDGAAQFVVLDWTPLPSHYGVLLGPSGPSFSPDSRRVAYVATGGPGEYVLGVDARVWRLPGVPILGAELVWTSDTILRTLVVDKRTVWRYTVSVDA